MLKDIIRGQVEETVSYELIFDDGADNGFAFNCDKDGNVLPDITDEVKKNLAYCRKHPEKFVRYAKTVRRKRRFRNPGTGTCSCGATVILTNDYYGACQCEKCGQWYNTSGQELLPPDKWGWDGAPW